MPPSLAKNWGMPNKDRSFHESPEKAGGEGWLYSEQQQKLCHFKPDTATVHAQWVAIRTYSYVPPRPPEPMTRRRMLRHNAIEAWETKTLPPSCSLRQTDPAGTADMGPRPARSPPERDAIQIRV